MSVFQCSITLPHPYALKVYGLLKVSVFNEHYGCTDKSEVARTRPNILILDAFVGA